MRPPFDRLSYVLITPARNEVSHFPQTIKSVLQQTLLPFKWVVVDDGSTDGTGDLVEKYLAGHPWIELVRRRDPEKRNFAAKVFAFQEGFRRVADLPYDVIGCLDADVSFEADYLAFLLGKFAEDPRLGVAGTPFVEEGYSSLTKSFEGETHVAGGCQLFRRKCFEEIGGYIPNPAGGIDWIAVTTARMKGWRTRSFREKTFHHYRSLGTAESGALVSAFQYGKKDYYLGNHPFWEAFRVIYQCSAKPYVLHGLCIFAGYFWAWLTRMKRPVSRELMIFHRREELAKLKVIFKSVLRLKKLDHFELSAGSQPK